MLHSLPATIATALIAGAEGAGRGVGRLAEMVGPIALLAAVLIAGIVAIMVLRKKLLNRDAGAGQSVGFTLASLRKMHEQGKLTDEEYQRAREHMAQRVREDASPPDEGR